MKLIIAKDNLISAVMTVSKAVPSKTTMPILECILINAATEKIKLTANDTELGIETTVAGEIAEHGVIAVPADIFTNIVRKLPDGDVRIDTKDETVTIRCGQSRFTIQGRDGQDEELAVIYETEQKEQEIAAQRASLNSQRMQAIVVVVLLLLIFLGVLFEFYRKLRRAHTLLEISYNNLVIANERAEESSKMKTNFIRQISHEIRTPLNILSGFTQIITMPDMKLDEATRTDINHKIVENTDRITGLVNKMLELSDASSQAVIDRTDNVLAVQIAAQATDASEVANAKHLKFDLQVGDAEGAVTITTNEQAATRALTMLLDNARKFTRPAEAKNEKQTEQQQVTLTLKKTESTIEFIVEDTGIGVPINEAEHIFDEFVQLDEYYEGTGIGLTVARSLARRLGGDVVLDTTYTSGARFVMTLPLA